MVNIRLADPAHDGDALSRLAEQCPQGDSQFQFFYERRDFWERSRVYPESHVLVAESNGQIVGTATVSFKDAWISGQTHRVAYLYDRMVAPSQRRQGIGRRFLREQLAIAQSRDAHLVYSYVLDNNTANHGLMESEGLVAHPRRAEFYTLFAKRGEPSESAAGQRMRFDTPHAPPPAPAWQAVAESLRGRYEFVDPSPASCDEFLQVDHAAALAGVRRHLPKHFVHVPWLYRLAGRWLWSVPRVGERFLSWSLHYLWAAQPSPDRWQRLLQAARWLAAADGIHVVNVPLFGDDPLVPLVRRAGINRFGIKPTLVRLYLSGPAARTLLESRRPLVVSGRDL